MTVGVVWLLKIPGLMLLGGLGLVWIAYRLLVDDSEKSHSGPVRTTFWGAMKTIMVAAALMGVDNVLGVAGAARGSMDLVVIGLLVSEPFLDPLFDGPALWDTVTRWGTYVAAVGGVMAAGWWVKRRA